VPRKITHGLEYHPESVIFFEGIDVKRAIAYGGDTSMTLYAMIKNDIFRTGHYFKFKSMDDLIFNYSEKLRRTEEETRRAFDALFKYDFLDIELFEKGYLTSVEIQEIYYEATKKRKIRFIDHQWLLTEEQMRYLDIPRKQRKKMESATEVEQSTPQVVVGTPEVFPSTQSNSKSKSESKNKKDKLIYNDLGKIPLTSLPFDSDYYFRMYYNQDILSGLEEKAKEINDMFIEFRELYDPDELHKAIKYTANRIKVNKWMDSNNKPIINKHTYLRETITNNIYMIQKNRKDANDARPFEDKLLENLPGLKHLVK
jgi:hypothetical protein